MDNWLGKVSRHPTGSAIIGGVASVAIIAAATHWWKPIAELIATAWHATGSWLLSPMTMPHSHFIGWLSLVAVLAFAAALPFIGLSFRYALSWRQLLIPPPPSLPTRAPNLSAIESATMTDEDRDILKFVISYDGSSVPVDSVREKFGWGRLITQQYIDRLEVAGLLESHMAPAGSSFFEQMQPEIQVVKITPQGIKLSISLGWLSTASNVAEL